MMTKATHRLSKMAGAIAAGFSSKKGKGKSPTARMLRDSETGIIRSRQVGLIDTKHDIERVWRRSAALAQDIIQNSGRLSGAVDQVIGDTVGAGLTLTPTPDLKAFGYSDDEAIEWISDSKKRWQRWSKSERECDFRGKLTVAKIVDVALRYYMAFGEVTAVLQFFSEQARKSYGLKTSFKVLLIPPHRLVTETKDHEGLFQGVIHDDNGRPVAYRVRTGQPFDPKTDDFSAYDAEGRKVFIHLFDPLGSEDVRGISKLAACFKTYLSQDKLASATLNTAIAQSAVAMVLTSELPSADAFEGLSTLSQGNMQAGDGLTDELRGYLQAQYQAAKDGDGLSFDGGPMVPHIAPGEDFRYETPTIPGNNYIPFSQDLRREIARTIGVTYSAYSMDFTNATYSSVRMETASIWPVVLRRRERIAAALMQAIYEGWLDEQIGKGLISFKGGYDAFFANRDMVCAAQWNGPPKPTADDLKSAKASTERMKNGTTSRDQESAENGIDPDETYAQRLADHKRHQDNGLPSPYVEKSDGRTGVDGGDDQKQLEGLEAT